AAGRGTLVLMNDEIHAAAAVTKTNTTRVDAFVSPEAGPLGVADADRIVFGAAPGSRAELAGAFAEVVAGDGSVDLPRVAIGYAYAGADGEALRHLAGGPTRGLVLATVGQGNLPAGQREAAADLAREGMVVVLSSRTNGGRVPVGAVRYGAGGGEAGRRAPLLEAPPRAACSAPAPSTRRRRGSSSCSRSPAGTTRRRWPRLSVASEKDGAVRRAEIFARDDQTCVYCGRRAPDVE